MSDQSKPVVETAAVSAPEAGAALVESTTPVVAEEVEILRAELNVLQNELQQLKAELEQSRAKSEQHWSQYLQAEAEMQNLRRRAEREKQEAHKYALERFVAELLPVADSLELGLAAMNDASAVEKLREGSEMTLKLLSGALEKFGVKAVNPQGAKFNPDLHQAMVMQPSAKAEPNTVLQVYQKGYTLNERLVRPALVVVAKSSA